MEGALRAIVWHGPEQMSVEEVPEPAAEAGTLSFHGIVRGQIGVQGSYAYTREDFARAIELLSSGRAGLRELPDALPLKAGPDTFAELAGGPSEPIKVYGSGAAR